VDGRTDGKTARQTDGQTGIKPILPSGYFGRGLIRIANGNKTSNIQFKKKKRINEKET
jgi:hypothetical protein